MSQNGRVQPLRHFGDDRVLLLVEELGEQLHAFVGVPEEIVRLHRQGGTLEEAPDGALAGLLDPSAEIANEVRLVVRVDVALPGLLREQFLVPLHGPPQHPLQLPGELREGQRGAVDLVHRILQPLDVAKVQAFASFGEGARLDALVEDVGQGMGEKVLVEFAPAAEFVDRIADLLRHRLEEILDVAVLDVPSVFDIALAVLQLQRGNELLVDVLLDLVLRMDILRQQGFRPLREMLDHEARRMVVDGRLRTEEIGQARHLLADLFRFGAFDSRAGRHFLPCRLGDVHQLLHVLLQRHHVCKRFHLLRVQRLGRLQTLRRRAFHELRSQVHQRAEVEVGGERLLQRGGIVAGELDGVRDAFLKVEGKNLGEEGVQRLVQRTVQRHVHVLDAARGQKRRQAGAQVADELAAVLARQIQPEAVALLDAHPREVLERRLHADEQLGLGELPLQLVDEPPELHLAFDHLLVRRELLCTFLRRAVLEERRVVQPVRVQLQVVALELFLGSLEAALRHGRLEEVVEDLHAAARRVEDAVEGFQRLLDFAAGKRLARVQHLARAVPGRQDHVADVELLGFADVLEVAAHRLDELLAHEPVVRRADVGAPGNGHVDLVVDLLELQAAGRSPGEADIALVGAGAVVHHLPEIVDLQIGVDAPDVACVDVFRHGRAGLPFPGFDGSERIRQARYRQRPGKQA